MNILVTTLKEELKTAKRLERTYLQRLTTLPQGSFILRKVKNSYYGYLTRRKEGKVVQEYLGKMDEKKLEYYRNALLQRHTYKKKLKSVREQIIILRKALRGKAT